MGSTDTSDKDNNAAHCLLYFQNKVSRKPVISVRVLVGAVVTLLFMTAGYVFFGGILYGSWALGLASAPGLLLKSVVNLIVFIVVGTGLSKVVKTDKMKEENESC